MTGRRIIIWFVVLSFFPCFKVLGQDVVYSQFYASPLYLNPALAGATLSPRLNAHYRNQWPALDNAFTSYGISYDHYIDAISSAVGIFANIDRIGGNLMNSTMAQLVYSYRLRASRSVSINMAVSGGIFQKSLDWNALEFETPVSAEYQANNTPVTVPDFNFGAVLGYRNIFYAGFALAHITQPSSSFYEDGLDKLYRKFTFHAGGNIFIGEQEYSSSPPKLTLSPAFVYIRQYKYQQINLGMNVSVYPFVVGMWYRNNIQNPDAVIVFVGFQYQGFQVGYSYDIIVSEFTNATGGAHEFSLGYRFKPSKVSRKTIERDKEIPCPKF